MAWPRARASPRNISAVTVAATKTDVARDTSKDQQAVTTARRGQPERRVSAVLRTLAVLSPRLPQAFPVRLVGKGTMPTE
eukprot:scaffold3674_cov371-Prasinococcus_capsulatus_cf.AAC.2